MRQVQLTASRRGRATTWRGRAGRALAAIALVVPVAALGGGSGAGASAGGIRLLYKWRVFTHAPTLRQAVTALDVDGRIAYSFSQPQTATAPMALRAWNLDTLKPLTPLYSGPLVPPITPLTPVAVDSHNHTVVVAPQVADGTIPTAMVLGIRDGAIKLIATVTSRFAAGYQIDGISIDAAHGRLIVLGAPTFSDPSNRALLSPAAGATQVDLWKLDDLARGTVASTLTTPAAVPSACGQPMTNAFPAGATSSRDGNAIYFGCVGNRSSVTTQNGPLLGEIAGVGRLTLNGATSAFRLFTVAGNFTGGDSVAAPGANRIVLTAPTPGQSNLKVFDTVHERYVGNVGFDGLGVYGFAYDPNTGRAYMVVHDGLGAFEMKPVPTTQGTVLTEYVQLLGQSQQQIVFDPKTRRLFVPSADDPVHGTDPYLLVFQDTAPPYQVDATVDPDAGALDVPEVPGKTDSDRSTTAEAVGADYRMVGGTTNLIYNLGNFGSQATFHPGTRYGQFAAVHGVRLTNEEADASAVTLKYDATTQTDTTVQEPDYGVDVYDGVLAVPAMCSDLGEGIVKQAGDSATVSCDVAKQASEGSASASMARIVVGRISSEVAKRTTKDTPPLPDSVQIRHASSHVKTERLASGVTKTTATAEADGIDILGVVQIGKVVATAVTETHGRHGTAHATYTRTFSDVTVNGTAVCTASCSFSTVQEKVNDALAGRANIDVPTPAKVQSPGGTTAEVSTDVYRHEEDTLLNEEPADSVVTPAMMISVYTDGTAQSRLLVRLATLSSKQSYRIIDTSESEWVDHGPVPGPPVRVVTPGKAGTPTTTETIGGTHDTSTPTAIGSTGGDNGGLFGSVLNGLRVVFRSPGQVAGIAAVWLLLALPAYLSARRRLLLELPRLRRVQEDS